MQSKSSAVTDRTIDQIGQRILTVFATMRKLTSSALRDPWLAGGGGKTLFTEGE